MAENINIDISEENINLDIVDEQDIALDIVDESPISVDILDEQDINISIEPDNEINIDIQGSPSTPSYFVDLIDVPNNYTSDAGKLVRVNSAENGLEFGDKLEWEYISGNISDNTNLQAELDSKVDKTTEINNYPLTGDINLTKSDIGLGNVDNTSDLNKPISNATQNALDLKANISSLDDVAYSGDHSDLINLDYASSGHTGFEPTVIKADILAGSGISVSNGIDKVIATDVTISNTDRGSTAVATHEANYDHSKLHNPLTVTDSSTIEFNLSGQSLTANVKESGLQLNDLGEKSYNSLTDKPLIPTDHNQLTSIGSNTHADIDIHLSNVSNPHNVNKDQVGLGNVDNIKQIPLSYLDTDGTLANNSDTKVATQKAVKTYVDNLPAPTSTFLALTDTPSSYSGAASKAVYVKADQTGLEFKDAVSSDEKVKYNASDLVAGYLADKVIAGTGISLSEDTDRLQITNTDLGSSAVSTHESTYNHSLIATAIQPGDNITELVNNIGYLTSYIETDPIFIASDFYNKSIITTLGSPGSDTNIPTEQAVRSAISASGGGDVSGPSSSINNNIAIFSGLSGKLIQDSGLNINSLLTSEWNTAYSWGNHATAGYLTNINSESISDLIDVDTTGVVDGKILKWQTDKFIIADDEVGNDEKIKLDASDPTAGYLDAKLQEGIKAIQFDLSSTVTIQPGLLRWNAEENTLDLGMNDEVIQQIGQEIFFPVKNQTGFLISNGTVVRFAGTLGNSGKFLIEPMLGDGTYPSEYVMGVVTEDIPDGEDGLVTHFGKVRNIKTDYSGTGSWGTTWQDGDILYLSAEDPGVLTNVRPAAPNNDITIAAVIHAHSNGTIFVRPTWAPKMTDLQDINGTALTTSGQIPVWDNTNGYFDFTANINNYLTNNQTITLSGDLSGSGSTSINAQINSSAVGENEIASNAVTTNKIANSNITYAKIQNTSTSQVLIGRYSPGSGIVQEIALGTGLEFSAGVLQVDAEAIEVGATWGTINGDIEDQTDLHNQLTTAKKTAITMGVRNGGYVTPGTYQTKIVVPRNITPKKWYLVADNTSSIEVDVWARNLAIPTSSIYSICGTELPTLTNSQLSSDTTLTTWTSLNTGDVLVMNVNSAAQCEGFTLVIEGENS